MDFLVRISRFCDEKEQAKLFAYSILRVKATTLELRYNIDLNVLIVLF